MVLVSPLSSYSDTTPHKRAITDVIALIDPSDTPAIELLGGLDGAASKFRLLNFPHTQVEWLEDTLAPLTGTLSASCTSTTTGISVADADRVQIGDIILIDSEQMWVSARDTSTDVVTVTRAYSGSSASHAASATITKVGQARLEGADSSPLSFTDRTAPLNYTQIFHKEVKVSRTQNQLSQYGIAREFDYQIDKAIPELMRLVERQFFYGARKAGSATTPRAFGGIETFVTDNLTTGATLAQSQFEDALELSYADGGSGPWVAFCSPANMQKIKNFYDTSSFLRVDRSEDTAGMVIERIMSPFGWVDLVMDRWAKDSVIAIVDPDNVGFLTYYPFTFEPLAKSGDFELGQVVGELTLCVRQDKSHALLTAVS